MARHGIALVDDDPHTVTLLDELFSEEGYRTLAISAGADAYTTIAREAPDLVVLDLWLEQQDTGWTIYDRLRADDATARIPIIVCSADVGTLRQRAAEVVARGDATIEKPFDIASLLALVADLLNLTPAPLYRS
ncbi:MAG: response regulator [Chloroflexota bacterium]|nr:response regulator [Chloroflexota bacterium]